MCGDSDSVPQSESREGDVCPLSPVVAGKGRLMQMVRLAGFWGCQELPTVLVSPFRVSENPQTGVGGAIFPSELPWTALLSVPFTFQPRMYFWSEGQGNL